MTDKLAEKKQWLCQFYLRHKINDNIEEFKKKSEIGLEYIRETKTRDEYMRKICTKRQRRLQQIFQY